MLRLIIIVVVITALAACTPAARPTPVAQPAPTGAVEVQELVRRVVDGQQGRREVQGVVVQGTVSATRVDWPIDLPRTYYADVEVLGQGGRVHTMIDCATSLPIRVGDPVILEIPHSDPRQGCFVSGRQVPPRPLIYEIPRERTNASMVTPTKYRLDAVPYVTLGWPQSYDFALSANVQMSWAGDNNLNADAPAPASLDLEIVLEDADGTLITQLAYLTSHADAGNPIFRWSGQYQVDDYFLRGIPSLNDGREIFVAFYVERGLHIRQMV